MSEDNRIGIFRVDIDLIENDPRLVRQIMSRCVIVKAECLYAHKCIEYTAICNEFLNVPLGSVPRFYRAIFFNGVFSHWE